jgi:hypothetical protein
MSDPENFLSRWSRRKREPEKAPKPAADVAPATPEEDRNFGGAPADKPVTAGNASQAPEPAFDPASLPPLDSIGAETDISAFLKTNVPSPLRLAALRRAWSADPAIRDFKGLADYDWDFTAPDSMRGFGNLDPGTDVQKMLADMFGDNPRAPEAAAELPNPAEQIIPQQEKLSGPMDAEPSPEPAASVEDESNLSSDNKTMVQRKENIAARDKNTDADDSPGRCRRSQGSALPQ